MMLLCEKEVQTCLEFGLIPFLKEYFIEVKEVSLYIHDKICIDARIIYQDHTVNMKASFLLDYQNQCLCFYDITGSAEYLFLNIKIMNVLKQLLKNTDVKIKDNACYYKIDLPIQSIGIQQGQLEIKLKQRT